MNFIGIIPARLESTRFPRKLLADICGKPMIQHVYERAKECLDVVYVACDHYDIFDAVIAFGGHAVMTSMTHTSGTNRCLEAYNKIRKFERNISSDDIIINIQGDQPVLHPAHINALKECFIEWPRIPDMATVAFINEDWDNQVSYDKAFVALDIYNNALYFSRYIIPYASPTSLVKKKLFQHIGIYGFTVKGLITFCGTCQTDLEKLEGLEQNRWLENGRKIKVGISGVSNMTIDTEQDLKKVVEFIKIRDKIK